MKTQDDQCEHAKEREARESSFHRETPFARQQPVCRCECGGPFYYRTGRAEAQACWIKYAAPWLALALVAISVCALSSFVYAQRNDDVLRRPGTFVLETSNRLSGVIADESYQRSCTHRRSAAALVGSFASMGCAPKRCSSG